MIIKSFVCFVLLINLIDYTMGLPLEASSIINLAEIMLDSD